MNRARDLPIVIAGPTASGKSALALALAQALDGAVINADSMQVYRELRVLTARPDAEEERLAPHHLYGVMSVRERCSAGIWRARARAVIAEVRAAGKRPIVVGGTGLYLRALLAGIAEIPPIPPAVRQEAQALHARIGGAAFRELLAERDPQRAARLSPGDSQRLIRAYEIVLETGRTMASFLASDPAEGLAATILLLDPPRDRLAARIAARCAAMIEAGARDEVAALLANALDPSLPAMKAVGVPVLTSHLRGDIDAADMLALFIRDTQHYARRQRTWFRHQLSPDLTIDAQYSESLLPEILRFIRDPR